MLCSGSASAGLRCTSLTPSLPASHLCLQMLWQIPDSVSHEDAAVLPIAYGTAWLALCRRARLQPG